MTYENKFNKPPYYDDFNKEKNYVKILIKPEVSLQTRELNQIQTNTQWQNSQIYDYILPNTTFVTNGELDTFRCDYVKIEQVEFDHTNYEGNYFVDVDGLVSKYITGANSDGADVTNTLYINYTNTTSTSTKYTQNTDITKCAVLDVINISGEYVIGDVITGSISGAQATVYATDFVNNQIHITYVDASRFTFNESLIGASTGSSTFVEEVEEEETLHIYDSVTVANPIGYGRLASLSSGVYYYNGYFINIPRQISVIEHYNYINGYKIGLTMEEKVITSSDDSTLLDNAAGFSNENAPGADRYQISGILSSVGLFAETPENFFTLVKINNNELIKDINQEQTSLDRRLADRTYEESGNYILNEPKYNIFDFGDVYTPDDYKFTTQAQALNFANEKFGIDGAFSSGGFWYPCNTQNELDENVESHYIIQFEPNIAYIKGYRYEYETLQEIICDKTRDSRTNNNITSIKETSPYVKVSPITNLPDISNLEELDILDGTDTVIGKMRVVNFDKESTYYRVYFIEHSLNPGKEFAVDAKKLSGTNFEGTLLIENDVAVLYNTNTNLLIETQFNSVRSISDLSINVKKYVTGTTDGSGTISFNAEANEAFLPYNDVYYTLTDQSGNVVDISGSFNLANPTLTLTLGGAYANQDIEFIYTVLVTNPIQRNKTLVADYNQAVASPANEIDLDHIDIFRIKGIYDSGDTGTPATISDTNVTNNYILNTGQRDLFYDFGSITLKDGYNEPTGQLLIVYDHFTHSNGDYFSISSYSVDYVDIPTYTGTEKTYDLTDCLDFRQIKTGSGFDVAGKSANILNNTITQYDVEYYLPRKDHIIINSLGDLNIKYGYPNETSKYPIINNNNILIFKLDLQPYVKTIKDVNVIPVFKRRYTMEQIGELESRIRFLEDYIKNISSNTSSDDANINSIFTDDFTKLSGDIENKDYKASVDLYNNILRAYSDTYSCSSEVESQNNVVVNNNIVSLPFTEATYVTTDTPNTSLKILVSDKDKNNIYFHIDTDTITNFDLDKQFKDNTNNTDISDNNFIYNSPLNNWIGNEDE
jgi:hypothetical protein